MYSLEHAKRLNFVRRCRELAFTVEEIRELLALVDGGRYTCDEVREMLMRHLSEVRRRICALQVMEGALEEMAAGCTGGQVPACPFIDTLYAGPIGDSESK